MDQIEENTESEKVKHRRIDTTVGDLILAIAEAAEEATIGSEHISEVTQMVLEDMLTRKKD